MSFGIGDMSAVSEAAPSGGGVSGVKTGSRVKSGNSVKGGTKAGATNALAPIVRVGAWA